MTSLASIEQKVARLLAEWAFYELRLSIAEIKAGFNPNQPRVSAGNEDGGRWTEIGVIAGNNSVKYVTSVKSPSSKKSQQVNIFVGGNSDASSKIVKNSVSLHRLAVGDNYYSSYQGRDDIVEFIRRTPKTRKINLIGHSWGGDTVAWVVTDIPERVHTLITIDPVSWISPDLKKVGNSVKKWVNVNAVGKPSGNTTIGNFWAGIGRSWDKDPERYADIYIDAPTVHDNFTEMMLYAPKDGKSPQIILNKE